MFFCGDWKRKYCAGTVNGYRISPRVYPTFYTVNIALIPTTQAAQPPLLLPPFINPIETPNTISCGDAFYFIEVSEKMPAATRGHGYGFLRLYIKVINTACENIFTLGRNPSSQE